jgi:hypothetical protein
LRRIRTALSIQPVGFDQSIAGGVEPANNHTPAIGTLCNDSRNHHFGAGLDQRVGGEITKVAWSRAVEIVTLKQGNAGGIVGGT